MNPTQSDAPPPSPAPVPAQGPWIDALHIFALVNFAVAQPVYDRLTERPVFLVDLNVGRLEIFALVGLITVLLPAVLVLCEWLVRCCVKRAYPFVHLGLVLVLSYLSLMPVMKMIPLTTVLTFCSGVVAAVVATWCYARYRQVRQLISWAALGIVIFPAVFVTRISSGISASLPPSSRTENFSAAPVVMLILDEFCGSALMNPDREIDEGRFPNFAALAREATWYRDASAVHHFTEHAVPAILSGQYATTKTMRFPTDVPQHLFNVMRITGNYEQAAFEPLTRFAGSTKTTTSDEERYFSKKMTFILAAVSRVYLYHVSPEGFARRLPEIPRAWFGMVNDIALDPNQLRGTVRYAWGNRRDQQFDHFLRCIDGSSNPTLYFMHLLQPHVPWSYLPSGRRYAADGNDWEMLDLTTHGPGGDVWGHDQLEVIQSQQRYLLQLMYVDRQLGRLISRLKETGIYDRCLLVVTADHGISFRVNQPRRRIVAGNQDEILSIPLFIKRPEQKTGGTSDQAVESVDLLPTIADVVGIKLNGKSDGWSVFDTAHPKRQQRTYTSNSDHIHFDSQVITQSAVPAEIRQRFGDSADPLNLFRIGPAPELVGRKVDSLKLSDAPPIEVRLFRNGDQLDPEGEIQVPCLFEGIIQTSRQSPEASTIVAVSVNGTIQAVTRTYQQPGFLDQWAAMVPETAFREGANDVQFYIVQKSGTDVVLTRCAKRSPTEEELSERRHQTFTPPPP